MISASKGPNKVRYCHQLTLFQTLRQCLWLYASNGVFFLQYLNLGSMGKKVTEEVQGEYQGSNTVEQKGISQKQEIIGDNTSLLQNNTNTQATKGPSAPSAGKTSQIQKNRKVRVYNPDDRFLSEHIKRYYLFPFHYSTLFPYFKISWKVWKPNSVYKKMAQYLSNIPGLPDKTSIQCKSFDQRMKDLNYVSQPDSKKVDLFEAALTYLKNEDLSQEDRDVIHRYISKMKERGSYMTYLHDHGLEDEGVQSAEESKKSPEPFVADEKKEETSIEPHMLSELIFNEFLDIDQ